MPNLPTKDTKRRFLKLMKKSGKSKTNTMYGGVDTSKKKISTYDPGHEKLIIRFRDFINEDVNQNLELEDIQKYLIEHYPEEWWNNEFNERVYDYISDEDYIGEGDPDDELTWLYGSAQDAYQSFAMGGAIEYDLLDLIRQDIIEKFHLTDKEYDQYDIGDIVENYMVEVCDWCDRYLFGKDNYLNVKERERDDLVNDLTKRANELSDIDGIKL
jgi:hypothetical protein